MTFEEAIDSSYETYMIWQVERINAKCAHNPLFRILLSYPGSPEFLRSIWARQYYEHHIEKLNL